MLIFALLAEPYMKTNRCRSVPSSGVVKYKKNGAANAAAPLHKIG